MNIRLDQFLWCVRLAKTRRLSKQLIDKNKVQLNHNNAKPSKNVQIGDEISIKKSNAIFTYKVLDLLNKRVGAKLVAQYIEDITPVTEIEKFKSYRAAQSTYPNLGKPSKKERRQIEQFLQQNNS